MYLSEQLEGQLCSSFSRGLDDREVFARLSPSGECFLEKGAMPLDNLEHVIEVMGHAPGEQADRLQLL
jgi:hypothetical protein